MERWRWGRYGKVVVKWSGCDWRETELLLVLLLVLVITVMRLLRLCDMLS